MVARHLNGQKYGFVEHNSGSDLHEQLSAHFRSQIHSCRISCFLEISLALLCTANSSLQIAC